MDKNEISLEDELKIMNELLGKRVIGFDKVIDTTDRNIWLYDKENDLYRNKGIYSDIMIMDNGDRYLVEMTDYDCCANALGTIFLPDGEFEGVITEVESSEKTVDYGGETTRYATIKLLFENSKTAEIRMSANNGNGDYYMSVATLIIRPIPEINNGTSFEEDMREQDKNDKWVYSLRSY